MSLRRAAAAAVLSTALVSTAALAPAGATTVDASSERAAAKGCVSKAEYRKIKNGMTIAKVKRITGTAGKQVSKTPLPDGKFVVGRAYKVCTSKNGGVGIAFTNQTSSSYKVASKSAVWG
ncbi:hypothetical protein [Nocardioides sp. 1609]|uniref:hypothetical protein n=1 Tax=Nocardioides sp. 1609 TaxID=2508327 RepID=UPI00106FC94C|nr:hypothetical protein [Nocardioides sp. 1609]